MRINQLKIKGFRCYESLEIDFDHRINVFSGSNGAGKTSVLEAIYFLSTGKSFRSKRNKNLINHDQSEFAVFTQFSQDNISHHQLGITLNKGLQKKIRLDRQNINNQSDIAHMLPVVSIDPDSYLFLDKPPQFRRSFLDWLVFHVKPNYLGVWSKVARCQKQLNSLFKAKETKQLDHWEQLYTEYATELTLMRQAVFADLQTIIHKRIGNIVPELDVIETGLHQGWSHDFSLQQQIKNDRRKNLLYGNLNNGVHKMDIKNTIKHKPAHESLSRGQKKLISIIYYLSYVELLSEQLSTNPVLCLDDMDAELDADKTQVLCDFIEHSKNQAFITTVDSKKLMPLLKNACLFHVEQQKITPKGA